MPTADEEFIRKLRATFQLEAEEHLQTISSALLEMEKPASSLRGEAVESAYREAHSLKGAARAVDYLEIEAVCQRLEDIFFTMKRDRNTPSPDTIRMIFNSLDGMRSLLAEGMAGSLRAGSSIPAEPSQKLDQMKLTPLTSRDNQMPPPVNTNVVSSNPPAGMQDTLPELDNPPDETVRVSISKLDACLYQAEDMLPIKATIAQRATVLKQLTLEFESWRKRWITLAPHLRVLRTASKKSAGTISDPVTAATALTDFLDWNDKRMRMLEKQVQSLVRQVTNDRYLIGKRIDDLLEDTKKLLMLPFSSLATGLPKVVHDICREQGKEADIAIHGGEVEIDRRILEEMKGALIHILRNSVDHGVETRLERSRSGKPPRAILNVGLVRVSGGKVQIVISDDGAGVDIKRVKESAVRLGIISEADARALADDSALDLIFHSEVTASPVVTSISGRGLGMAIVRERVERLGGRIVVESCRGAGTTLRMTLPNTIATFRGILMTVGDRLFIMPTANVERVLRIKRHEIKTVENREAISLDGVALSFVRLQDALELPSETRPSASEESTATVIVNVAGIRVAYAVDSVLHEEEVLVKSFRKPLSRVRYCSGAAVVSSGQTVPVLHPGDLLRSTANIGSVVRLAARARETGLAPPKRIIVVEDSITSRMLLKGILESAGFSVTTAVDGVDAFTKLREETFELVISDVEMPRMNGFDLTARIRADKNLTDLPIILVTALEKPKDRERGIEAGANVYLVKSTFDQGNLLDFVHRLT